MWSTACILFFAVPGDSEERTKKKTTLKKGTDGRQKQNQNASNVQGKRPGNHLEQLKLQETLHSSTAAKYFLHLRNAAVVLANAHNRCGKAKVVSGKDTFVLFLRQEISTHQDKLNRGKGVEHHSSGTEVARPHPLAEGNH